VFLELVIGEHGIGEERVIGDRGAPHAGTVMPGASLVFESRSVDVGYSMLRIMPPVPLPLAPDVKVIAKPTRLLAFPRAGRRGAAGRIRVDLEADAGITAGPCAHRPASGTLRLTTCSTEWRLGPCRRCLLQLVVGIGAVAIANTKLPSYPRVVADVTRRILVDHARVVFTHPPVPVDPPVPVESAGAGGSAGFAAAGVGAAAGVAAAARGAARVGAAAGVAAAARGAARVGAAAGVAAAARGAPELEPPALLPPLEEPPEFRAAAGGAARVGAPGVPAAARGAAARGAAAGVAAAARGAARVRAAAGVASAELARPPEALLPPWPGLPPEECAPPEFEPPLAGGGLLVVGEHPKAKSAKESPKAPTAYGLERWELSLCMVRSCSVVRPG